jgi:uroporphyrinogen-III synthase
VAEGLLEALREYEMHGAAVLIARAAVARDTLPSELSRRGAFVDVVEAYRTIVPTDLAARAAAALKGNPDWVAFTSSSTVTNFVEAAGGAAALAGVRAASIGPITSATLRGYGIEPRLEAEKYTVEGIVEAIKNACASAC